MVGADGVEPPELSQQIYSLPRCPYGINSHGYEDVYHVVDFNDMIDGVLPYVDLKNTDIR
jgi:hypothetical protein